jgi:hypothetical protein
MTERTLTTNQNAVAMSFLKVLLQTIRERKLPMFAWSRGGAIHSRCPRCSAAIKLSAISSGAQAFQCQACGEEGTWTGPTEPKARG